MFFCNPSDVCSDFMYKIITVSDIVRVPPSYFTMDLKTAVKQLLQEKYERKVDAENGVILKIFNIRDIEGGKVILGDGASYYDVKYDVLTFLPEVHEIVEGEITEVLDFGAFVLIGPFDGLLHLSQITNEYVSFDKKAGALITKNTKKTLKKGDIVRAKIVTVSLKPTIPETKIALTLKGEGLGKLEWLAEEREKEKGEVEEKKEKKGEKEEKGKEKKEKEEKKTKKK